MTNIKQSKLENYIFNSLMYVPKIKWTKNEQAHPCRMYGVRHVRRLTNPFNLRQRCNSTTWEWAIQISWKKLNSSIKNTECMSISKCNIISYHFVYEIFATECLANNNQSSLQTNYFLLSVIYIYLFFNRR